MPEVFVAAGSNINPGARLREALALLDGYYGPLRVSPAYRNATVGFSGEDFVNLALGFTTDESPRQVIAKLQSIEARCGRPRGYIRRFDLCRICFREYALEGQIPGVTKASW